jgi:hypothetical protein
MKATRVLELLLVVVTIASSASAFAYAPNFVTKLIEEQLQRDYCAWILVAAKMPL